MDMKNGKDDAHAFKDDSPSYFMMGLPPCHRPRIIFMDLNIQGTTSVR